MQLSPPPLLALPMPRAVACDTQISVPNLQLSAPRIAQGVLCYDMP